MSKSYHSKKEYKQRVKEVKAFREGVDKDVLARHPNGTRAKGLKRLYRGWWKVSDYRDRFGEAEEQSYRLRRMRRAVKHAARKRVHGSV